MSTPSAGMEPVSTVLSRIVQDAFRKTVGDVAGIEKIGVVPTENPEFGDFQCNGAMAIGKGLGRKPRDLAQQVVTAIGTGVQIEKCDVAGPGFINIRLTKEWLAECTMAMGADARLAVPEVGRDRTVVVDYSSPNVAKPMHIGHIRSTIIGNAIDRMYRYLGYRVVSDNHLGDWGTQFGIIIMGFRNFVDVKAFEAEPVEELERIYVKSYERSQSDETWLQACRQELVKLQSGDPENRALWKRFVAVSLAEFDKIYRRLGVSFDHVRGESFYNDDLQGIVDLLQAKGIARESEGALVAFLEEEKLPVCIVRKSDGAFNYATTDLATVSRRIREFQPERIIYVTDERQQLHFRQVFATARRMGLTARLDHVWFGLMRLPEGTFSTRQGNVIKLERLLDEAERRALDVVRQTSPEMPAERQKDVARAVGIGAVKYADLSQNPQSVVTFTWEKALALDGNSAPYLQYAYARISSVSDKYAERFPGVNPDAWPLRFVEPIERTLALKVTRFPDVVIEAAEKYRPSHLADYLYDLSQTYSSFYQNVPFLKAEEGLRESRVRLCRITARVLSQGLHLLGIETPERI